MLNTANRIVLLFVLAALISCGDSSTQEPEKTLPFIGRHDFELRTNEYGTEVMDTIYHKIPAFNMMNQDSVWVNQDKFKGKIYVADFFFTHCPTICPKKTENLHTVQQSLDAAGLLGDVLLVSYTVDPKRDSIPVLREYADVRDIDTKNWDFLTGDKRTIYELAMDGYYISVSDEEDVPGGILHTDAFILVDQQGHIRGVYDGTDTPDNQRMIEDIKWLIDHGREHQTKEN